MNTGQKALERVKRTGGVLPNARRSMSAVSLPLVQKRAGGTIPTVCATNCGSRLFLDVYGWYEVGTTISTLRFVK